jgi:serine O-acetyltransferase
MFSNLKEDFSAYRPGQRPRLINMFSLGMIDAGFRANCIYRLAFWCRNHKLSFIGKFLDRVMHHLCHCWISCEAEIGPGFRIAHVACPMIPPGVKAGEGLTIRNNVILGGNYGKKKTRADGVTQTKPYLGDNVSLGPGCCLLGPIEIGSNVIIGANAVVTTDIPDNSVVGAFRAEVLAVTDNHRNIVRPDKNKYISRQEIYDRIEALERLLDK